MLKYFFFSFLVSTFSGNISHCQTAIENDNLYGIGIFQPDNEMKTEKIRMVRKYIKTPEKDKTILEETVYDKNGYLLIRKNFGMVNSNDSEIIVITNSNYATFILDRKIAKKNLLRAGENPYSFWGLYFPLLAYKQTENKDTLWVKSTYKWSKDSSIIYNTYLNGVEIDSGVSVSLKISTDSTILQNHQGFQAITDTIISKDTLIVNSKEQLNGISQKRSASYYSGKLVREEQNWYQHDSLISKSYTLFIYDDIDRKITEMIYDSKGNLYMKRQYMYEGDKKEYRVLEEKFGYAGEIETTKLFDNKGRILEESRAYWRGQLIKEKTVHKYLKNGLKEKEQVFNNGKIAAEYYWEYLNW